MPTQPGIFPSIKKNSVFFGRIFLRLITGILMGERISWKKGKKCRSSDSIKRGKKKVYSSSRWGYYSRFLSMTRIRQRIFDQKVWMGIDRFSSPHSGCLRFEFLVKMEGKKTLYDWGRSSSRLNQRHSFICLKSRCGETLSQVHQTLEAGIVSSRKYFPLYFNGHQKVIHLFRGRREKKRKKSFFWTEEFSHRGEKSYCDWWRVENPLDQLSFSPEEYL